MSVDVVIPCYNYAHFLPQCVGSALSQEVDGLRVIIIDNASTDDSVAVARRLAADDSRVEVICHERNLGPHASFNEGICRARAEYFIILCADDVLAEGALRRGLAAFEQHRDAVVVLGAVSEPWFSDEMPPAMEQPDDWDLLPGSDLIARWCGAMGNDSGAHAMLVRTPVQRRTGFYRDQITHMDDLEMLLRLALAGDVIRLRGALVIQRMHTTNQIGALWQDRLADLRERDAAFSSFFQQEGASLANARQLHRRARTRLGEAAYWSAVSHLARGERGAAMELFKYASRMRPATKLLPPLGYLLRTDGISRRVKSVLKEAIGRRMGLGGVAKILAFLSLGN